MTILCIRAIREYIYISTVLGKNLTETEKYEKLTYRMQEQLVKRLWSEDLNYLINYYAGGTLDPHIYIGSLLSAHFNLIDREKKIELVKTAEENLLNKKIGVYNVFPMDFHQLIDFLKFSGNEAGEPFVYANGGIWPHGNAWYTLALISIGRYEEALNFLKDIMTIEGIVNSPNGHPAMYEYRNSNYQNSLEYGKIDKPQFLWAAAWYLYSLYNLLGVRENEWNISFEPYLFENQKSSRFDIFVNGKSVLVNVRGRSKYIKSIKYDGLPYPSAVIPEELNIKEKVAIVLGTLETPYISHANSILYSCHYNEEEKSLIAIFKAFQGHQSEISLISPWEPKTVKLNRVELINDWDLEYNQDVYRVNINFSHQSVRDTIYIQF